MKKYELSEYTMTYNIDCDGKSIPVKLHRVRALMNIGSVAKKGDLGGWVQSEKNLSQNGECWVDKDCIICSDATVRDNSIVRNTRMYGASTVCGSSTVEDCVLYETSTIENATVRNARLDKDSYITKSMVNNTFVNLVNCNILNTCDLVTLSGVCGYFEDAALKVSFYRNRNNDIYVSYNTYAGSLSSFEDYILRNCKEGLVEEWTMILNYVKKHFKILDDSGDDLSTAKQYERSLEDLEERKLKHKESKEQDLDDAEDLQENGFDEKQRQLLLSRNATMLSNASQMIIIATNVINAANEINQELVKSNKIGFDL